MKEIVGTGALGRVVEYEARFERFRPELRPNNWRERDDPGSGMLLELGPHLVDQALMLFARRKRLPGKVTGSGKAARWTMLSTFAGNIRSCAPGCAPESLRIRRGPILLSMEPKVRS